MRCSAGPRVPARMSGPAGSRGGALAGRSSWIRRQLARIGPVICAGPRTRNEVALTFDDGPNDPCTGRIREILDSRGVRGTFFMPGKAVEARPDIARDVCERGHVLGQHSWSHRRRDALDPHYRELALSENSFRAAVGRVPAFFRPPYGFHTPFVWRAARRRGIRIVMWDVEGIDWAGDAGDDIAARVLAQVRPGSIVLLHDGAAHDANGDRSGTVDALPTILDGLARRSLVAVGLDQLLGLPAYLEGAPA